MNRSTRPPASVMREISESVESSRSELANRIDRLLELFITQQSQGEAKQRKKPLIGDPHQQYIRISNVAEALMLWHTHENFVTKDGAPRPLSLSGRISLTSLSRRVTARSEEIKQLLIDLVELPLACDENNRYVPSGRSAIHKSRSEANLAYATLAICRLLETITSNLSGRASPLFERQVSNVRIHVHDVPIFLRFVQQQGQYLIDSIDDWLLRRTSSEHDSMSVGIGAFAWIDTDWAKAKSR